MKMSDVCQMKQILQNVDKMLPGNRMLD